MAKKTYELADKSVGFFDPETRVKVVGDGKLVVDDKERVGRFTTQTIKAGGLIEVNRKSQEEDEQEKEPEQKPSEAIGGKKRGR